MAFSSHDRRYDVGKQLQCRRRLIVFMLAVVVAVSCFLLGVEYENGYFRSQLPWMLTADAAQGNNAHVIVTIPDESDFPVNEVHTDEASIWEMDSDPSTIAALKSNVLYSIPAHYVFGGPKKKSIRARNVENVDGEMVSLERTTLQPEVGIYATTFIAGTSASASFGGAAHLTAEYSLLYFRPSDEWVVLQDGEVEGGSLLHCRLPLPVTAEDVKEREAALLIAAVGERRKGDCEPTLKNQQRLGAILWKWILEKTDEFSPSEGCLHGDGEGSVTGFSQWYIFCPRHFVGRLRGEKERQQRRKIRQWRSYLRAHSSSAAFKKKQADLSRMDAAVPSSFPISWFKSVASSGAHLYQQGAQLLSFVKNGAEHSDDDSSDALENFFDEDEYAATGAKGNQYDEIRVFSHNQKFARDAFEAEGKRDEERFGNGKERRMGNRRKLFQTPSSPTSARNGNPAADTLDADSESFSERQYTSKLGGVATVGGDDSQEAESSQFDAFKILHQKKELEIIGVFDPLVTPNARWSATHQAWEFFFPSEETLGPRGSHASNYLIDPNATRNRTAAREDAARRQHVRQSMDTATGERYEQEYRRLSEASTVVRLRCTTQQREGHFWVVTQVRQTHRFIIEIGSTLVCPWEAARNTLRMNPILCNALD